MSGLSKGVNVSYGDDGLYAPPKSADRKNASTLVERPLSRGVPPPKSVISAYPAREGNIPLSPPCQSLKILRAGRISRQYLSVNCRYHGCNTVASSKYWLVLVAHGPYRKLRG
jgi:hypothetical protein